MADPVNSGEEIVSSPTSIGLTPDAQFRTLSGRLDEVAREVSRIQKPKAFRLADIINLAAIAVALLIAVFTALGLKDRISDLVTAQTSSETRLNAQIVASEGRVSGRLDRMDDRFTKLDERTAVIEGQRGVVKPQ